MLIVSMLSLVYGFFIVIFSLIVFSPVKITFLRAFMFGFLLICLFYRGFLVWKEFRLVSSSWLFIILFLILFHFCQYFVSLLICSCFFVYLSLRYIYCYLCSHGPDYFITTFDLESVKTMASLNIYLWENSVLAKTRQ